jgi:hypothetical protein
VPNGDIYDVPDLPIAWTATGCDQEGLMVCDFPGCGDVFHEDVIANHLWLTHRIPSEEEPDDKVAHATFGWAGRVSDPEQHAAFQGRIRP